MDQVYGNCSNSGIRSNLRNYDNVMKASIFNYDSSRSFDRCRLDSSNSAQHPFQRKKFSIVSSKSQRILEVQRGPTPQGFKHIHFFRTNRWYYYGIGELSHCSIVSEQIISCYSHCFCKLALIQDFPCVGQSLL